MKPSNPNFQAELTNHLPHIRRIVARIVKNDQLVDDLSQECCVRIIEKEALWDSKQGKLKQWMNTLARNLTIKRTQQINLQQQKSQALVDEPAIDTEDHDFYENIHWVLDQMKKLPPRQKQILKMRYFDEMKMIDIAQSLGISQPAVSIQIQRALKTLQKQAKSEHLLTFIFPKIWFSKGGQSKKIGPTKTFLNRESLMFSKVAATILLTVLGIYCFSFHESFNLSPEATGVTHDMLPENRASSPKAILPIDLPHLPSGNSALSFKSSLIEDQNKRPINSQSEGENKVAEGFIHIAWYGYELPSEVADRYVQNFKQGNLFPESFFEKFQNEMQSNVRVSFQHMTSRGVLNSDFEVLFSAQFLGDPDVGYLADIKGLLNPKYDSIRLSIRLQQASGYGFKSEVLPTDQNQVIELDDMDAVLGEHYAFRVKGINAEEDRLFVFSLTRDNNPKSDVPVGSSNFSAMSQNEIEADQSKASKTYFVIDEN